MENGIQHDMDKLTDEDLFKKHRQERKDLQSRIQSMKKSIPKGDKKKKKEISDLIAQLEADLNEKQDKELSLENNTQLDNKLESVNINNEEENSTSNSAARMSKARRRREKKDLQDRERERQIQEESENYREGPRMLEINSIKNNLQTLGLALYSIPADGNCLYCAINHQLESKGEEIYSIEKLRKLTAEFIRENKDEFLPFMYNDSDEVVNEEEFHKFCDKIAKTKLWGGQLELRALSQVLKCPIKVIQSSGPPTVLGEDFEGQELVLTYHRHLYRLGEHYNSTTAQENSVSDDGEC